MKRLLIPPAVFVLLLLLYHYRATGSLEGEIHSVREDIFTVDCSDAIQDGITGAMLGEGVGYLCRIVVTEETIFTDEEGKSLGIGDFEKGVRAEFVLEEAQRITEKSATRFFEVEKVILKHE